MTFHQLIHYRYSVRAFRPDPVEPMKLERVVEAFCIAPTAANRQPFRLYVIETAKHRETLKRLYGREWFVQAPYVLGVVAVPEEAWTRRDGVNYAEVDATIAFDHLILQAAELGLGTCWVAAFDPQVARELLGYPPTWQPVAFTPLGYPADAPKPKIRRPQEELVVYV
ncbi:MAG: nitroreductase family protein [candidate division KSB1 bacterium]|nr:nitroreductase family protein [candidate division KSB1 bacterium]